MDKPTMLVVLDGFGYAPPGPGNAISLANMPFWSHLQQHYPHQLLKAAGCDVGLLPGSVGNSEVGHMTLGAGRVVPSSLLLFEQLIAQDGLTTHPALRACLERLQQTGGRLHVLGLLSDGGVHSHQRHAYALLEVLSKLSNTPIFVHPILDGRDVLPKSAQHYLEAMEAVCKTLSHAQIVSVQGRFYAMDRDNNSERTELAVRMLTGQVPAAARSWQEVLDRSYKHDVTDEFVVPVLLHAQGAIRPGDGVIFFNTRPDRARQLARLLGGDSGIGSQLAFFLCPVQFNNPAPPNNAYLFEQPRLHDTLLHVLAEQGKRTFVIAETEKYAHVSYFFQGQHEGVLPHQERVMVPSLKAKNYIMHPEMGAHQITSTLIKSLRADPASFYLVNFANPDMVGHAGDVAATSRACECIDQQIALLYHEVVERKHGLLCITADHGNAESKQDAQGNPLTAHTANSVPILFAQKRMHQVHHPQWAEAKYGLAHVAPTLLSLMGQPIPPAMEEKLLYKNK